MIEIIRPPLHGCKENRILTRGCPRFLIRFDWRLVPEREKQNYWNGQILCKPNAIGKC